MVHFKMNRNPVFIAIFNEAQNDNCHTALVTKLARIFRENDLRSFTSAFVTCLKVTLSSSGDVSVSVDKVFEFIAQFIISVSGLDVPDNSNIPEDAINFLNHIFEFFEKFHSSPNQNVRKRICQLISKLLLRMGEEAMLDYKICDVIVNVMKERIKDKIPAIRIQAIMAVFRLQEKENKSCPVTKMLIQCIETDTCAEVRRTAVSKVALSQRSYINIVLDRIDDVSEKVRKETYTVLSKLHIKLFTLEQRTRLLNTGIYDNSELVKNTVKTVLLPAWLKRMDSDYLKLLKALDLNVDFMEVATIALMSLLQTEPSEVALDTVDACIDKLGLISFDQLNSESAFFWRCYVFHVSELVKEENNYCWESNKSFDPKEKGLLPDLSVFCEYIRKYYQIQRADENPAWKKMELEFILIQLIELCKVYDYADEVGRRELKVLCLDLLKDVEMETVKPIIELYFMLQTNLNESISKITELINDLLYPNIPTAEETVALEQEGQSTAQRITETNDAQKQNIKFKIAQFEVKLVELKDAQEDAVKIEDFMKAQDLKGDISDVQDRIQELKASLLDTLPSNGSCDLMSDDGDDTMSMLSQEKEQTDEDEVGRILENLKPDVVRRCLVILQEMLHLTLVKQLTPELRMLFQMVVLPACKSDNVSVAPLAVEVLGSLCLRDKALAKEYFTTFFAFCGDSEICVSALKVIFDCLLCFGPNTFNINNFDDYEKNETEQGTSTIERNSDSDFSDVEKNEDTSSTLKAEENKTVSQEGLISGYTFISVLVDLLDDEFVEARLTVVHGLCQLMATGKLKSSKVLTRLILIWFHPASKNSAEIRDCLNFFFPFFVKNCAWAGQLFENAIIPTMDVLFNAPVHNPLSEVDQKCVLKVLCDLTSPSFVQDGPQANESIHVNMAIQICNHIMDLVDANHQAVLLKGLDYLDLSTADPSILPTLTNFASKIVKKFKKKNYTKKSIGDAKKIETKFSSLITDKKFSPLATDELRECEAK